MKKSNVSIAICSEATGDQVLKFIDLEEFKSVFQTSYNNGNIWGCYYDENENIVGKDIWENVHADILKTEKDRQIESAANHFIELYAEEIAAGEISGDTIHEWWSQTAEQYSELTTDDFEAIEKIINL